MGVYIKNMEMPNKKNGAVLIIYPDGKCAFEDGKTYQAVPVPPHGRLIDADALEKDIDKYIGGEESRSRFHHWVQVQRTVIPESKEART